jgi:signal transduction histidine kinase
VGNLHGQFTPYIIGEFPSVFSEIETQFEQEEIDSVLTLCTYILNEKQDAKIKGIAYFYKGQAQSMDFSHEFAVASFLNAEQIFKKINFGKGLAMVYCKTADLLFFQKIYSRADTFYNRSIDYAEKERLFDVLADVYEKKANIYTNFVEPEVSINLLKSALKYATLEEDNNRCENIINQISTNYHSIGYLDSAIVYFQKAIHLKKTIEDAEGLISDYSALGKLHNERGAYEEAQQNLIAALKIAEKEADTFSIITVYSEIGDVYAAQKVWQTSQQYYTNALQLAQLKKSRFAEAGCLKRLGNIFHLQNKKDQATENYEAALKVYEQLGSIINAADVLKSLGQLYKDKKQFFKAKAFLQEALAVRSQSPDKLSSLSIKMVLAEIEISHGELLKGIVYCEESLAIYKEMGDKNGIKLCYSLLAEANAKVGNFEKAYQFYQKYSQANDSLTSIEKTKAINELELRYNTEKKDKEIALQKVAIEKQEVEIQKRNNQLLLLAGSLTVIGLITTLLLFINRKNRQLNQQRIEVLKKEQETKLLKGIIEGEEKERKRVARELHDGLGAVLATVKMVISSIQHKIPKVQTMPTYQKAETLIDEACRTVREISHDLMPQVLEQHGVEFALDDMCQTFSNNNNIDFEFIYFGTEEFLSDVLKTTIFRITQELLKNIIKHADANEVIVQLTIEDKELILIVEDNGKGFDASSTYKGIGLGNIRSRVAYMEGTLEIESIIGQGSTFIIQLPINQE